MKFNLKQKCLLDASGELTEAARQALLEEVTQDPQANAEYQTARDHFAVFNALAIPEPSAAERRHIPAQIKRAIHGALLQHEKKAGRGRMLLGCAVGMGLAACVALFSGIMISRQSQDARRQGQVARIQAMIDRVTPADGVARGMVVPLVITTPSENEENGLSAVAVVPEDQGERGSNDASAPPGSF